MICRVDNNGQEVCLSQAKFSDILAVIQIWLHKDKEICYSKPVSVEEYIGKVEYHE